MVQALLAVQEIFPDYDIHPTGSVYYRGVGNDCDVLVQVAGFFSERTAQEKLEQEGFVRCGGIGYPELDTWAAYRRGNINIILCYGEAEYRLWCAAARTCKFMGTQTSREVHIALHKIIVKGEPLDG